MNQSQPFPFRQQAAVFVDYDNLLDVIRAEHSGDQYPDEYAAEILDEAQRYIKNRNDLPVSITRAYADFGALDDDAPYIQRDLQRSGFEPRYVPSGLQRNATELQLSLDVMQAIEAHAAIETVVLIAGDRPYLPLIRRIAEQGRHVLAILLFPPGPDDAPFFVKDDVFFDARNLLSEASKQAFPANHRTAQDAPARLEPHEYHALTDPIVRRTVEITEEHFGQYDEVYLTPLLRKLSDILGPEHDPKSLISRLEEAGAVRLEKRNGYPYDYTVLIMHGDHPDVAEIQDALQDQTGYGDGYYDESYHDEYDAAYADADDEDAGEDDEDDVADDVPASAAPDEDDAHDAPADAAYDEAEYDGDAYNGDPYDESEEEPQQTS